MHKKVLPVDPGRTLEDVWKHLTLLCWLNSYKNTYWLALLEGEFFGEQTNLSQMDVCRGATYFISVTPTVQKNNTFFSFSVMLYISLRPAKIPASKKIF